MNDIVLHNLKVIKLFRLRAKRDHYKNLKTESVKRQDWDDAYDQRQIQWDTETIIKEIEEELKFDVSTLKKLLEVKLYRLCETFNKLDVEDKNGNWDKFCEKVKIKMDLAEKIVSIKKRLNK